MATVSPEWGLTWLNETLIELDASDLCSAKPLSPTTCLRVLHLASLHVDALGRDINLDLDLYAEPDLGWECRSPPSSAPAHSAPAPS